MINKEVIKYKKFIFTQSGLQLFTHICIHIGSVAYR